MTAPASASARRSRRVGTKRYRSITMTIETTRAATRGAAPPMVVVRSAAARRSSCWASRSSTVAATVRSTSTAEPTTSTRSTSFPRAGGRPRSSPSTTSSAVRIAAIIPIAAHTKRSSVARPTSPEGDAIPEMASATSRRLVTPAGSARTTVSTTALWTSRSPSRRPNAATTTIASGTIENSTR